MDDSIRLGRVLQIPIGVNWSIVAVAALFTVALAVQAFPQSAPESGIGIRLTAAAIAVVLFFASILAHELGHAVAALSNGVAVQGITLWLLGGVAKLDRQAPTARAEFQIALAGPAVSFGLGVFFSALTVITMALTSLPLVVAVLAWLGGTNLLLAVFNMLPAAPLDGGRVLTALLWKRRGDAEEARLLSGRCGLVLGTLLVVFGVVQVFGFRQLSGWLTVLVGAFAFNAARAEIVGAVIRRRLLTSTVAPSTPPTSVVATKRRRPAFRILDGASRTPTRYGSMAAVPRRYQSLARSAPPNSVAKTPQSSAAHTEPLVASRLLGIETLLLLANDSCTTTQRLSDVVFTCEVPGLFKGEPTKGSFAGFGDGSLGFGRREHEPNVSVLVRLLSGVGPDRHADDMDRTSLPRPWARSRRPLSSLASRSATDSGSFSPGLP